MHIFSTARVEDIRGLGKDLHKGLFFSHSKTFSSSNFKKLHFAVDKCFSKGGYPFQICVKIMREKNDLSKRGKFRSSPQGFTRNSVENGFRKYIDSQIVTSCFFIYCE